MNKYKTVGRFFTFTALFFAFLLFLDYLDVKCFFRANGTFRDHLLTFFSFLGVRIDFAVFLLTAIGAAVCFVLMRKAKNNPNPEPARDTEM